MRNKDGNWNFTEPMMLRPNFLFLTKAVQNLLLKTKKKKRRILDIELENCG